jgi:hypothetical protein
MRQAIRTLSLLLAAASIGCQTGAPPPEVPDAIEVKPEPTAVIEETFEPANGVSCHRPTSTCQWRGGVSVGLTRIFFGDAAAEAVDPAARAKNFPHDPIFNPSFGASCDTLVTTCYDSSGASDALTSRYFGAEASRRLSARLPQVVRYGKHVTCDQATKICYDRFGAGVGVTHLYIGDAESTALLARLRARDS